MGADRIGADAVVAAAGAWTAGVCAPLGLRVPAGPPRGQIVPARRPGTGTAAWPAVLPAQDPCLVAFPAGRIVAGATREQAGFAYHATVGGVGGLLAAAAGLAPGLRHAELLATRIGSRPVTSDGRPLPGPLADALIVATGHGPQGLTASPRTGLAAALLTLGQPPVTDLTPLHPSRFHAPPSTRAPSPGPPTTSPQTALHRGTGNGHRASPPPNQQNTGIPSSAHTRPLADNTVPTTSDK